LGERLRAEAGSCNVSKTRDKIMDFNTEKYTSDFPREVSISWTEEPQERESLDPLAKKKKNLKRRSSGFDLSRGSRGESGPLDRPEENPFGISHTGSLEWR
jgi:hypothetical protein